MASLPLQPAASMVLLVWRLWWEPLRGMRWANCLRVGRGQNSPDSARVLILCSLWGWGAHFSGPRGQRRISCNMPCGYFFIVFGTLTLSCLPVCCLPSLTCVEVPQALSAPWLPPSSPCAWYVFIFPVNRSLLKERSCLFSPAAAVGSAQSRWVWAPASKVFLLLETSVPSRCVQGALPIGKEQLPSSSYFLPYQETTVANLTTGPWKLL